MNLIKTLVFSLLIISVPFLGYADIKSKIEKKLYSKINNFAENLGDGVAESLSDFERLKYLDFSINIQDSLEPTVQIQSVSSIKEYDDGALFNQLNLMSHDSETTINLGFGKRKLLDNDALMIGTNLFVDYQFDESHLRTGLGLEAVSSSLDIIANYYNAISGFKKTSTGSEKALDGYDLKLNYRLSKSYNTDLFVQLFEWENPNSTFEEKGEKIGINSSIGNLALELGYLNDNKDNDGLFGSLKVIIPLGGNNSKEIPNEIDTNQKKLSVRDKLYMPVQRENKIKLVKLSSGVKVSGF